ncbi:MAG TPA: tetratricopeptide repeat protein [Candidatus Anaerostipes avistercoris]|uniref:Tetratricopeptide repeat protein n=1 Tax=Candidatus Anaerostipes avistercoris TaxID=2838462 RepID=A0A9D2PKP3_9FIRM|nr:tetratricopeptide repeat protein [Candidatus Anaerostipes avistercoris]
MDNKMKKIVIVILAIVLILLAVSGYGYVTQKTTANDGIEYLNDKQYQTAYEKFHEASGKFTLFWTSQKTDVLLYEGEALYQLERYDDAIEVYDRLIDKGESRAYSFKAFCYVGKGDEEKAIEVCDEGIAEMPEAGGIYCTKYGILAKQEKYEEGIKVLETALDQEDLEDRKEVLFTRIGAYESTFDYDKAYEYAKEFVKQYPDDKNGQKELTFLETR